MVNNSKHKRLQAGIIVSLFCFVLTLSACGDNDKVIARVEDRTLTESEAYILMNHLGYDAQNDTVYQQFIDDWIERTVYAVDLEKNYPEKWQLIRYRSDSYASDLAKVELEDINLSKKLDTVVSNEEIVNYFNEHKDEFVLTDYLVRALYLKIPVGVEFKEEGIHEKYLLKKDKDLPEINAFAKLYAENYYFDDSSWTYFTELSEDIPLGKYNVDNIVLNRTKTYFADDDYWYFLNIIDYQLKDEAPPLEFLKDQIKRIIISGRLQELTDKERPQLLKRLKKKYEIEINP